MTVTYFNENTGDEVELDEPSARLDSLDNWQRIDKGGERPPVVNDGILSRPSLVGPKASQGPGQVLVETSPPAEGEVPVQDTPPVELTPVPVAVGDDLKAPNKSASKADWVAYARTRAETPEEEAAIDDLTRDQLVDKYGGSS